MFNISDLLFCRICSCDFTGGLLPTNPLRSVIGRKKTFSKQPCKKLLINPKRH